MSGEDDNGYDADEDTFADIERALGLRVELGLQPLSNLLGGLTGATESGSSGLPASGNAGGWTNLGGRAGTPRDADEDSRRRRPDREREPADRYRIDTRRDDGAFIVVADLPGAVVDELSVGIDRITNELVIEKGDTLVGRVELPFSPDATRARFHNGVLEVCLRPGNA